MGAHVHVGQRKAAAIAGLDDGRPSAHPAFVAFRRTTASKIAGVRLQRGLDLLVDLLST